MEVEGQTSLPFNLFAHWFEPKRLLALDIETNVVSSILDRILITIQFADKEEAWVIQWSYLSSEEQQWLLDELNKSHRKYIIHSGTFEGTVFLKYGVILKNIADTYRQEQILNTGKGAEEGSYNLESVIFKRFGITLDKSMQLQFGDDIMTKEKIQYAAMDVAKGVHLHELQLSDAIAFDKGFKQHHHKGLKKTMWWDNEFTLVATDLEYQGVLISPEKWIECYNKSYPAMLEAKEKLDKIVIEEFSFLAKEQGWLSNVNRFESIWGSSEKKKEILQLVFPDIENTTKLGLKEYLRDNDPNFPLVSDYMKSTDTYYTRKLKITGKEWEIHDYSKKEFYSNFGILKLLILREKDTETWVDRNLNSLFYSNFPEFMLERNYVIPANTLSLNWNSQQQKLVLFRYIKPSIEDTTALTVESNLLTHPLFKVYEAYQEMNALVTKFGLDYLKHIQADGRIRTVFNTVLATGRLSAKEPNVLQLPRNQDYRACFIAPEGFKIVDADYDSQELCILATLSKEPIWLDALQKGWDLHSINGQLLFKDIWDREAEEDCDFKLHKTKCHCKGHKPLRTKTKNLDFGLSYGLSSYGYAARNQVTEEYAKEIINEFFGLFKQVKNYLVKVSNFSVSAKLINENGTGRVRFFDAWKVAKKQNYHGEWEYANPEEMRGVMRAGANFTIQAFGASLLKVACVLVRRWINNNNLREHIQIMLPYHDQIILYAREGYEKLAAEKLEYYMKLSGKLLLKNDLLRATAKISDCWIKD